MGDPEPRRGSHQVRRPYDGKEGEISPPPASAAHLTRNRWTLDHLSGSLISNATRMTTTMMIKSYCHTRNSPFIYPLPQLSPSSITKTWNLSPLYLLRQVTFSRLVSRKTWPVLKVGNGEETYLGTK